MRNLFHVISVQSHLCEIMILKFIKEPTLMGSHLHVISVQGHFHRKALVTL
jgi:hypothetical protein